MMWDFSGGASSGQGPPPSYPQQQPRGLSPALSFPPSPRGLGYSSSAPAPAPFMPIGAPDDDARSYSSSYFNDVGPWAVPASNPAPISREVAPATSSYTVQTRYTSHHHHHSHSHSGHVHSHTPTRPSGYQSSSPPRAIEPRHHHHDPAPQLMPISSSGPGRTHFFQYSKCTGRRKALCIGINYRGQPNELHGCINDAQNVRRFLLHHGYKPDDIVMLTDDETTPRGLPTRVNILDGMKWLVRGAQPHDSLFFHYSGHGGQVKDTNGDEVDGFDEIIFPLDHKRAGYIVDDLLHTILVKPLPVGCRLTAIFDSCHSGSVLDLPYLYGHDGRLKASQVTPQWFDRLSTPADVITWSGCKDSQTSADTTEAGVAVGAMSYAFIHSMAQNPNQTYLELLRSIRAILKKKYSQRPQLSTSHRIDTNLKFIF